MKPLLLAATLLMGAGSAHAQQIADPEYVPRISRPSYQGAGPMVAIDAGHRNFHTLDGRYAPLGALLRADGYRVETFHEFATSNTLKNVNILIIANARSKYSESEARELRLWVEEGGSLLLIADHAPFSRYVTLLSSAFGVEMGGGYVAVRDGGEITSQIDYSGKALGTHPIVTGRNGKERVKRVRTFTGQSLGIPSGAVGLLILPSAAVEVEGREQVASLRRGIPVSGANVRGRAQAVALSVGKGRVVVAGEAAMFTAQRFATGGSIDRIGLTAVDDQQFTLNTLHWLSRLID